MERWNVAALVMAVSLPLAGVSAAPAHADGVADGRVPAVHAVRDDGPITFGKADCDRVKVTLDLATGTNRMARGSATAGQRPWRVRAAGDPYEILVDGKVVASGTIELGEKVSKIVRIPVGKKVKVEVRAGGKIVASATRTGVDCKPRPTPPPKPQTPKKKHKPPKSVCRTSAPSGSCKWVWPTA